MEQAINEAIANIKKTIRTKNDTFLVLCSLNLLNAAIKKEEYKDIIGYGRIKPAVGWLIQFCAAHNEQNLVDEIYYDLKGQCAYIRCFGIQFSFHNVGADRIGEKFITSSMNKLVEWDQIRLQPIALELYRLAKKYIDNKDSNAITKEFKIILDNQSAQ